MVRVSDYCINQKSNRMYLPDSSLYPRATQYYSEPILGAILRKLRFGNEVDTELKIGYF